MTTEPENASAYVAVFRVTDWLVVVIRSYVFDIDLKDGFLTVDIQSSANLRWDANIPPIIRRYRCRHRLRFNHPVSSSILNPLIIFLHVWFGLFETVQI